MSEEEYASLRDALILMLIVSTIALATFQIGIRLFAIEFELGIFLTPTIILLAGWVATSRKRSTDRRNLSAKSG